MNNAKELLDQYFSSSFENKSHIGLNFAVYSKKISHYWNYGYSDISEKRRTTENDFYEIGSVGKVFTALLFATLIRDGLCALSDPLRKYLPELPPDNSNDIQQLLTHRSGLPREPSNFKDIAPQNSFKNYGPSNLTEAISKIDSNLKLSPFAYSSFGYLLLGLLAKRVTGYQEFSELLSDRVLNPLGLLDTKFQLHSVDLKRFNHGHTDNQMPISYLDLGEVYNPAGGIKSTIADLLKFGMYFIEPELASTSMREPLQKTFELYKDFNGSILSFGWHVRQIDEKNYFYHPGHLAGTKSAIILSPHHKSAVAYCSNTSSHVRPVWDILKCLK